MLMFDSFLELQNVLTFWCFIKSVSATYVFQIYLIMLIVKIFLKLTIVFVPKYF